MVGSLQKKRQARSIIFKVQKKEENFNHHFIFSKKSLKIKGKINIFRGSRTKDFHVNRLIYTKSIKKQVFKDERTYQMES